MRYQFHAVLILFFCLFINHSQAAEVQPIKIAALYALTGNAALDNEDSWLGVRLAAEVVNQAGGVLGHPVQLIELDTQSSYLGARIAAQKAVTAGVVGVVGSAWSTHSMAMAPLLNQEQIPMISSSSTTPTLTHDKPYVFRVCFTDLFQGMVLAEYARERLKKQQAVVLNIIDNAFSTGLAQEFTKAFEARGGQVVWQGEYAENATNFSFIIDQLKQLQPDVVFIPGYLRDSGFIIKQAAQNGIKTQFIGGDGWDMKMTLYGGEFVYGNYFTSHWDSALADSVSQRFKAQFYQQYPEAGEPTAGSALAFDAFMVLIDAIQRAGVADPRQVQQALAHTQRYDGVTGYISFDENGDPVNKSAVILELTAAGTQFVTRIIAE